MEALLPIATKRLVLRAMEQGDVYVLAAYRNDPEVARYQDWELPYPMESARRIVAAGADRTGPVPGEWIQIAVTRQDRLIGDVAVGLDGAGTQARIGYTLAREHQGMGYAAEAVGAVIDGLFDRLHLHRIEATLDPDNVASARLVERLGFRYQGTAASAVLVRGRWEDDARYGLTRADRAAWRARPLGPPDDVRLVEITPDSVDAVGALVTHATQRRFVDSVVESFGHALFPEKVNDVAVVPWLRAVHADGELVGFVMLAERTDAHPEAYLWRLLIDRRHQGRGIGGKVLDLLVDRLRDEGHTSLLTSWSAEPHGPAGFYLAYGFLPTGNVVDDEVEARLDLVG